MKLKGSIVYDEYLSKDGYLYKVGDAIKINKPVNGDKFSFITDRFSQIQASSLMIGKDVVIKNIIVTGFKNTGYELCMTINNPLTADYILKFESAVSYGEIISKGMTRDEAIAKLKETKDLLDLGLVKQDDYDKLKAELTTIIMSK